MASISIRRKPSRAASNLAAELAAAHGFADRVETIQALSTEIELPEKADILVSDIRGVLPLWV